VESVLSEMDIVSQYLQTGVWDTRTIYAAITSLCDNLKLYGAQLENVYKGECGC